MRVGRPYTRRSFLERAGAFGGLLAFPGVVTACGGDNGVEGVTATTAGGDVRQRLATATGTVRTLLWEGYADPKAYAPILEDGRIKLESTHQALDEDAVTKRGTYDVGVGIDGVFPVYIDAGVAQPLDTDLIPNLDQVLDSEALFAPGTKASPYVLSDDVQYGMPFEWHTLAASYHVDEVPAPPESIGDFLDPAYKGKLGLGDDGQRIIQMVARHLNLGGTDSLGRQPAPAFLTSEEMDQVLKKMEEFREQARGFIANPYGEFASAYARGEIIAGFPDWPPTTASAQEGGVSVRIALVPEGISATDNFFISEEVDPNDAMYAFLNQALDAETQYAICNSLLIAPMNRVALDRLVKQGSPWDAYADVDAVLEAAPTQEAVPVESDEYLTLSEWLSRWEQFKAA